MDVGVFILPSEQEVEKAAFKRAEVILNKRITIFIRSKLKVKN